MTHQCTRQAYIVYNRSHTSTFNQRSKTWTQHGKKQFARIISLSWKCLREWDVVWNHSLGWTQNTTNSIGCWVDVGYPMSPHGGSAVCSAPQANWRCYQRAQQSWPLRWTHWTTGTLSPSPLGAKSKKLATVDQIFHSTNSVSTKIWTANSQYQKSSTTTKRQIHTMWEW